MKNDQNRMILAQITDLHIGFEGEGEVCQNSEKLQSVLREINSQILKPDVLLITGDLVESGSLWAYSKLRDQLSDVDCPILWAVGNHDNRDAFANIFPEAEFNDGFLQHAAENWPLRILTLDTLRSGYHGGYLCQTRLDWLDQKLSEKPDFPTLIAMHHPPIDTGIAWMTERDDAQWILALRTLLKKHEQVVHITAGHIHRSIFRKFDNLTVSVCPAIAPEVSLELAPIDPNFPDDRPLLNTSFPGYCLHYWNGETLTTHSANVTAGEPIVRHDKDHAFIVQHTMDGK